MNLFWELLEQPGSEYTSPQVGKPVVVWGKAAMFGVLKVRSGLQGKDDVLC